MSEQALEQRQSRARDVVCAASYSILALLVTLLWVYVPAWSLGSARVRRALSWPQSDRSSISGGAGAAADEVIESGGARSPVSASRAGSNSLEDPRRCARNLDASRHLSRTPLASTSRLRARWNLH